MTAIPWERRSRLRCGFPGDSIGPTSKPSWRDDMFEVPHVRRRVARFGALVISGIILALPPAAQSQVPGQPGRSRAPEVPPGAVKAPGHPGTRHPLDPLEPAEIELAVATVREE